MLQLEEFVAEFGLQWKRENEVIGRRQRKSRGGDNGDGDAAAAVVKKEKRDSGGSKRKSKGQALPKAKTAEKKGAAPSPAIDYVFKLDFATAWGMLQKIGCTYSSSYRPPNYVKGGEVYEDVSGLCNLLHSNKYLDRRHVECAKELGNDSLDLLKVYVACECSKWKSKNEVVGARQRKSRDPRSTGTSPLVDQSAFLEKKREVERAKEIERKRIQKEALKEARLEKAREEERERKLRDEKEEEERKLKEEEALRRLAEEELERNRPTDMLVFKREWPRLQREGWRYSRGNGLISWIYVVPG